MNKLIGALLIVVAIIHLLPLMGLLGPAQLSRLYGLDFSEPNLTLLMRHRAVLFGLLGAFLAYAAFQPSLRPLALVAGFASVLSFLWLAWTSPGYNALIGRVVVADIVALACLLLAAILQVWNRHAS